MSEAVSFTVPGQPQAQKRVRFARRGNSVHTFNASSADRDAVAVFARVAMGSRPPMEGPRHATIEFYLKAPQRKPTPWPSKTPDLDNLIKLVLDAMNGIVYVDDAQIVTLEAKKYYAGERGPETRVYVELPRPV